MFDVQCDICIVPACANLKVKSVLRDPTHSKQTKKKIPSYITERFSADIPNSSFVWNI